MNYKRLTLVFVLGAMLAFIASAQTTIKVQIAEGTDDAEEVIKPTSSQFGRMDVGSSDLELGNDGTYTQAVGVRYILPVANGDTISEAYLQFSADQESSGPLTLQIHAEAVDSAAAFTDDSANITSREKTTAMVEWTPFDWETQHAVADSQRTVDISPLIQEVVSRDGWVAGNAIVFVLTPTVISDTASFREAGSFEDGGDPAPALHLTFVAGPATIEVLIAEGTDDAEEVIKPTSSQFGRMDVGSSDLELGNDGTYTQAVGVRYILPVANGATISEAYLQFSADQESSGPLTLQIHAEATDNAAAFTDDSANITSREKTTAMVEWTPFDWETQHAVADSQKTVDISPLIQEVVSRDGWVAGNAIVFVLTPTVISDTASFREAGSFEDGGDPPPALHLTFVANPVTIEVLLAEGTDDAEEVIKPTSSQFGRMDVGSSDLELGNDGTYTQAVGVRYILPVGYGATISEAYLQFSADQESSGPLTLQIHAEAADNAAAFTEDSANITSREKTTAMVEWTPFDWETQHAVADSQKTVDIAPLIQEVVYRDGWVAGNAIVFVLTPTVISDTASFREAGSFEDGGDPPPALLLTFAGGLAAPVVPLSTDASLASLTIDVGTLAPVFDPAVFAYTAELPPGTTSVTVNAAATDLMATVAEAETVVDVSSLSGVASVEVTAEDGTTILTYTVTFTVSTVGVDMYPVSNIRFHHNSVIDQLKVFNSSEVEMLEIYSISGKLLNIVKAHNQESLEISTGNLPGGIYLVRMKLSSNRIETGKFIK